MKINRNISIFRRRLLMLAGPLFISLTLLGQVETTVINKQGKVSDQPHIYINLYDVQADILESNGQEVKVELEYIADGKAEDVKRLKENLESALLQVSDSKVDVRIDLTFQNNFNLEVMGMKWSKVKFKSGNKETIKLKEFKINSLKIWLPAKNQLNLEAKYSRLSIQPNIIGDFRLDAYDTQLSAHHFTGNLEGEAKYSDIKVGSLGNVNLDLYETKMKADKAQKVKVEAKYSNLTFSQMATLNLNIYEGKLTVQEVESLDISAKYAELELGNVKSLKLDAYEGSCRFAVAESIHLKAKYMEVSGDKVQELNISEGYESEFAINEVGLMVSIDGRYNEFSIGDVKESIVLSGYEDEVEIRSLNGHFIKVDLSGKYLSADIHISNPTPYVLKGTIQYPNIKINESSYRIRKKIGDDSKMEFEYEFKEVHEASPYFNVSGYEIDLKLSH